MEAKEQALINEALAEFKAEAERTFKQKASEKIKAIAEKQKAILKGQQELAALKVELQKMTLDQTEIDLQGEI